MSASGVVLVRDRNTVEEVCVVAKIDRVFLEGFGPRDVVSFEKECPPGKRVEATSHKSLVAVGQYRKGDRVKIVMEMLPRLYSKVREPWDS